MKRKFIVDFMLGRLCRWLKLLGEDAVYYRNSDKGGLIYRSLKERRIILTRDTGISRKKGLPLYAVQSDEFRKQLKEVIKKYNIEIDREKIFTRCIECNRRLKTVDKNKVKGKVPDYVYRNHEVFSVCDLCQKIYWKGTHRDLIEKVLKDIE